MNIEEAYYTIKKSVEAINTRPYATKAEYEKVECIKVLLTAYEKEKEKNKELENADLTSVWLDGVEDGKKYFKDKIKAKIEPKLKELDEQINEEWKKYGNSKELQDMEDMYNFLQSLLEKE